MGILSCSHLSRIGCPTFFYSSYVFCTDCNFFKLSESKSFKGQNPPVCKRKKSAQNQPVGKQIKTDKQIQEAAPELNPIGNSNDISWFDFLYLDLSWLWTIFMNTKFWIYSYFWAFHIRSLLSGCGMSYFFFGPLIFCTQSPKPTFCFSYLKKKYL